jgi:hypothetical protein
MTGSSSRISSRTPPMKARTAPTPLLGVLAELGEQLVPDRFCCEQLADDFEFRVQLCDAGCERM